MTSVERMKKAIAVEEKELKKAKDELKKSKDDLKKRGLTAGAPTRKYWAGLNKYIKIKEPNIARMKKELVELRKAEALKKKAKK